jgi:nucleotide-binding universal stress UspA family protein
VTIVVGFSPDKGGRASLELAVLLARSGRTEPLMVITVTPQHWTTPSMAKVDAEFQAWATGQGDAALQQAREILATKAPDLAVSYRQVAGRSVPAALARACADDNGSLLVVGSSRDGRPGQVVLGSTSEPLLHSSEVPVAIAPRGYRAHCTTISRLTCSYSGAEESGDLLVAVAEMSRRVGGTLRVVTFGVRGRTMYPPEVGLHAEDMVLEQWKTQVGEHQRAALDRLSELGLLPDSATAPTTAEIVTGSGWADAIDELEWERGEILVVGSSPLGTLARVFVGSRATKIIRYSPVPVVVVPAAVASKVAGELETESSTNIED